MRGIRILSARCGVIFVFFWGVLITMLPFIILVNKMKLNFLFIF